MLNSRKRKRTRKRDKEWFKELESLWMELQLIGVAVFGPNYDTRLGRQWVRLTKEVPNYSSVSINSPSFKSIIIQRYKGRTWYDGSPSKKLTHDQLIKIIKEDFVA